MLLNFVFFSTFVLMKKVILIVLFFPIIGFTQELVWSPYTTISSNTDGYGRPRIVLTADNHPLIIFRKDSSPKVLRASKWNGNNFSLPYDILQPGILPSSWDGPEVAAKGDTVYVVFTSSATSQSSIMLIKSFDGGLTFSDTIRVSENNPSYKFRMGNIAIKEDGNPVVSYMQYLLNWMNPKQLVNSSFTFGDHFVGATEGSQLAPGEPCDCCKSSLICSGDDVFLLFRNNHNNIRNSYIAKSVDNGISFTSTVDMDDFDWMLNACPETTPKGVVLGDSLAVVKRSGATGNNKIVCSNINKNDLNYSYNKNIDAISGSIQDCPELAANKDTIVVVWQDNRTGFLNCYMSLSLNGTINLDGSTSFTDSSVLGQKKYPDVEYADGNVHLVYLDYSQYKIVYVNAFIDVSNKICDINKSSSKSIVRKIDLLGREVNAKKSQPILYFYDDGTVEKRIVIE